MVFESVVNIIEEKRRVLVWGCKRGGYKDIVGLWLSFEVFVGRKVFYLGIEFRRDI